MKPIETAIVETLQRIGPCCLDDVVTSLPNSSWGEVFAAVDQMSRDGRVLLRQRGYSSYQLSIAPQFAHSPSSSTQMGQPSGDMARPQVSA
jgi:hypothetical protein